MQQVNLYQDEIRQIEPPYSAKAMVIVFVYCLIISLLIAVMLVVLTQIKTADLATEQANMLAVNKQLEATRKKYPASEIDQTIIIKIDVLKERKTRNKKVLNYLSTRSFDIGKQSFSGVLKALTEIQQKNLWLTEVAVKDGGREIKLTGQALSAELLPEYLKQLSTLKVFSEMEFEVFNMQRVNNQLRFVVSSKRDINDAKSILEKAVKNRK